MDRTHSWPNGVQFKTGPLDTHLASRVRLGGGTVHGTPCRNLSLEAPNKHHTSFLDLVPSPFHWKMAEKQGPTMLGIRLLPIWDHSSGSQVLSWYDGWCLNAAEHHSQSKIPASPVRMP